jgi:hypothetical protein
MDHATDILGIISARKEQRRKDSRGLLPEAAGFRDKVIGEPLRLSDLRQREFCSASRILRSYSRAGGFTAIKKTEKQPHAK